MTSFYIVCLLFLSYIIGSIPFGVIIGKVLLNIDIREHGSKNTGATNTVRVLGFKYGIFAFIFDMLKGAFVMFLVKVIGNESLYILSSYNIDFKAIYGLFAVIGHVFPVFLKFKGGKAVATSNGVIFAIHPIIGLGVTLSFIIVFLLTRIVSIASTTSALLVMVFFTTRLFIESTAANLYTKLIDLIIMLMLGALIFIRHKPNYERLKEGTEYKFERKNNKKAKK